MFWKSILLCLTALLFAARAEGQITFQKQIDDLNGLFCLEQTSDGTFWLGTYLGKIIRLGPDGQWLGGYTLQKGDTASTRFVYDLEKTPDGGVWALYDRNNDKTALDDYLILAKLSPDGLPVWQTPVHYGEVLHWAHNRLSSDPAGNCYALSARFSAPGSGQPSRIILGKVAPDGATIWSKAFFNTGVNYPRTLQRLQDGSFLICGNGQLASSYGFVLRVSADGDILWSKRYNHLLFKAFAELPDGGWVFTATEAGPLPQSTCLLRMDSNGDILWARRLQMPNALNWLPGLITSPSGDLLIFNYETPKEQPVADMICMSPEGNFKWATRYDLCRNYGISAGIITNDGGIACLRYRAGGHLFLKTDAQGICAGCPASTVDIPLFDITDFPNDFAWQVENRPPPFPANSDYLPFATTVHDFCGNEIPVTGISVTPDTVCVFASFSVSAEGPGGADKYAWVFPGATPGFLSGLDAVSGIQYNTPGPATVSLITDTGFCRDSFSAPVYVKNGPAPFYLGKDTTLCGAGALVVLNAATPGASDYTWSDGITGPGRSATETGTYVVTASTGNCSTSDTINIQILENLSVILPVDTTICGVDTMWLDASTPGAESYIWNDGFTGAIRPVTEQGYYAVTAFRGNCSGSDFIAVRPFPTPPALPADTLVCNNEPVTFSVGESLAGEIYWNGESGYSQYVFEDSGWVHRVINFQNCRFSDSVYVRRVECRDGFFYFAPNVFSPNGDGENDLFEVSGEGLDILIFQVFDRWGNLLVSRKNETPASWDGQVHGRSVQAGVYGWVARIQQRGRESWISGDVLVLR